MRVEQAVFTSARTSRYQGYHLVAQSSGIDDTLAHQLAQWGPTHGSLLAGDVDACSLSYFSPVEGWSVIARTVYGGPEYSGRGALQVVTTMLVVRDAQLAAYDANPLTLVRTALPLGHLRFRGLDAQRLPLVELPDQPLAAAPGPPAAPGADHPHIDSALRLVQQQQRVALVGMQQPNAALAAVLARLAPLERRLLSFATGLNPSQHRPFRLHLLPSVDARTYQRLSAQHIRCVSANV